MPHAADGEQAVTSREAHRPQDAQLDLWPGHAGRHGAAPSPDRRLPCRRHASSRPSIFTNDYGQAGSHRVVRE
ncbi:hypothetical protein L083_3512 [Actinoplanes sp. N902-109]|nr:hypothetical protein L083_3512 [Actinoplanes sp. N902-109]